MSRWAGKQVIGLTGNIATGKSIVRKMLERLGAFGIDADWLARQAISKGAPGYAPVVRTFGEWILGEDGHIDRTRLGRLVFSDPAALARLEAIVHPLVGQAVDILASRASQPVIVVEAIKLLESSLWQACDAIWVVVAPEDQQLARLRQMRGMSAADARQRMAAQSPSVEKEARASHVIDNGGRLEQTWAQVQRAWAESVTRPPEVAPSKAPIAARAGEVSVRRWRPSDAAAIAAFMAQVSGGSLTPSRAELLAGFRNYLIAEADGAMVGLAGWQIENLVTRVDQLYTAKGVPMGAVAPALIAAVEEASHDLQCEAALLFAPTELAAEAEQALAAAGYRLTTVRALAVSAWREAAIESQPPDSVMLFKRLREDRVLRPV